jgi:hypothetical protein
MIEDTDTGFRISLMQPAGMHEDTFTIRRSYDVSGSHSKLTKLYADAEKVWRVEDMD